MAGVALHGSWHIPLALWVTGWLVDGDGMVWHLALWLVDVWLSLVWHLISGVAGKDFVLPQLMKCVAGGSSATAVALCGFT